MCKTVNSFISEEEGFKVYSTFSREPLKRSQYRSTVMLVISFFLVLECSLSAWKRPMHIFPDRYRKESAQFSRQKHKLKKIAGDKMQNSTAFDVGVERHTQIKRG